MADDMVPKDVTSELATAQRTLSWTPVRSPQELFERFAQHPDLEQEVKKDLRLLAVLFQPPLESDKWIYRIVVMALGLAVLLSVGGAILLAWHSQGATPEGVVAIGSAAVGALAGLLAPSPAKNAG